MRWAAGEQSLTFHARSRGLLARTRRQGKYHAGPDDWADRPASAGSDHFHLKSDYLLILPDEDILQTERGVDMTLGSAHMTGTGMYVNNATREFRMAQRVHGTYPPQAARKAAN